MYRNSVNAFTQLLSPAVSQITAKVGRMQNGIAYRTVQITLASGEEYRIEAYDEEADELYRVAMEQSAILCLP